MRCPLKPALKVVVSSEYRIEKNIPVKRIVRGTIIYPFADMVKGDSFLVKTDGSHKAYRHASNSLHRQIRMFNSRFSADPEYVVRKVDGGVRCWRTK
jgi:hypothetical protein